MKIKPLTRRAFLGASAWTVGAFTFLPRRVLGGPGAPSPNETKTRAVIGLGRGMGFIRGDVLAVCDVDATRLAKGLEKAKGLTGGKAEGYKDFRHILDRSDIDEVCVVTPPHWHAAMSVMAAQAGKDVFCEKPFTRTIGEGCAVIRAIERYGVGFNYGAHTEGAPAELVRRAVQSGALGHPLTIHQSPALGCNLKVENWTGIVNPTPEPVPGHLDWDLYVGPAPMKPYHPHRTHGSFRGYWDYDGGGLADMAPHILNAIIPAMGKDHTGPVEIIPQSPPQDPEAVCTWFDARLRYDDGMSLEIHSGLRPGLQTPADGRHLFIEGPKGRLFLDAKKTPTTDPPNLLDDLLHFQPQMETSRLAGLPQRLRTVHHAHRVNCISILANSAFRTGRTLRFDPLAETFVGDAEAAALIAPPMRPPWRITV